MTTTARDVLIALCGLTPQVITETLWALAHLKPPVHPQELWILTTAAGKQACQQSLFGPTGALPRFLKEFGGRRQNALGYGPDKVIVLRGADGLPLVDLRTDQDNQAVADQIADVIRRHTSRPEVRLHCSAAGGRKTMGMLLTAILQLFGRAQDHLYHVLISPAFESHPDFFYKPRRSKILVTKDGQPLHTKHASIELADIPYVRLRDYLPDTILAHQSGLMALVARAQAELTALAQPGTIRFDATNYAVHIGHAVLSLTPQIFQVYAALTTLKSRHCLEPQRSHCDECTACYLPINQRSWDQARSRLETLAGPSSSLPADIESFRSVVSKVNAALRQGLGSQLLSRRYAIRSIGRQHAKAYGVATDKSLLS